MDVRHAFPQLGADLAYLDNAAGGMLPRASIDAVRDFLTRYGGANVRQSFGLSGDVTALKDRAREASAVFMNARPDEIAHGPSATALKWQLSRAFAGLCEAGRWSAGDEVIVSELEHEANHSPWRALERQGIRVRLWKARWPEGTLHVEDLAEMLSPRTRLVAMCAAANSTGTLTPVAEAARLTREAGGWTLVDAVHSAPHHLPDVRAWGVDFALMSPYKVFGPHLGVLWARQDLVADLPAEKLSFVADGDITKFEAGTAQHELLAGWLGTLSYLAELGGASAPAQAPTRGALVRAFERIEAAEAPVARALVEGLRDLAGVTLHGRQDMPGRVGTACFSVAGHRPRAVAEHLASRGVAVAAGHYYSVLPMTALGLMPDGAVRASIAHYTTTDEVGRLLDALRELPYSGA